MKKNFFFYFLTFIILFPNKSIFAAISFDKALDQIMESNTNVAIQKTNVDSASATSLGKKLALFPQVSLSAPLPGSSDVYSATGGLTGTVSLNILRWGADLAAMQAASADLESENQNLINTKLSAEKDAINALLTEIEQQKAVLALSTQVEIFNGYLSITQKRYREGRLPLQELAKIEIDTENIKAKLHNTKTLEAIAKANVIRLLGNSDIVIEWPWTDRIFSEKAKNLLKKNLTIAERADYRAAVEHLQAEEHRGDQAFRLILPSVDVTGSAGYLQYPGQPSFSGILGISLSMPLIDGFKDVTAYRVQAQASHAANLKLRQLERDIKSQWDAQKSEFETAMATTLARERTLKVAKKLYDTGFARFRQGRTTADDLLVEQTRLIDSQLLAIQGWINVHLAFTNLCHALGQSVKTCGQ